MPVVVAADGTEVQRRSAMPRRDVVSRAALDRLAELAGTLSPVARLCAGSTADGVATRLGAATRLVGGARADGDADGSLASLGLLDSGVLTEEAIAVLAVWQAPVLAIDLEVVVALRSGRVRVRSSHRNAAGRVVCLSTADGHAYELSRLVAGDWWLELARAAHVDTRTLGPAPGAEVVPDVVETPWELLLATGEAVQRRRHDLLDQLVSDHAGTTLAGDAPDAVRVADDSDVRRWHERLETTSRGRLHAAVMGRSGRGRPGAGVVEWVLLHDGWRSLTPFTRNGWTMVRIERRAPADLPRELSVRAAGVTS